MKLIGRRLPDLMIGILIVVLALGLGSLLLTQRNRTTQVPALPPAASEPATDIPAAPGTVNTAPGTVNTAPSTSAPPSASQPAASAPSTASTPTGPTPTGPTQTGSVAAPTTPQPDTSAPPVTTTPEPSVTAPGTVSAPPRSGGAVATSENRTPLRRDYRVSLGTFGSVAEANASTAAVRALGYAVYPIDLGSQVVAQVGPFADSATANAALSDIARAYGSAVVYAPRQSATGAAPTPAPTPTAPATSTPAATTPAPRAATPVPRAPANSVAPGFSAPDSSSAGTSTAPATTQPVAPPEAPSAPATEPATPRSDTPAPVPEPVTAAPVPATPKSSPPTSKVSAPAPSSPVYLQVGAFDRQESAQRMVGLLGDLGYNPSVQAPEGKKVTVLIGPFSGDAVLRAETKLNDNGFDHFRVR